VCVNEQQEDLESSKRATDYSKSLHIQSDKLLYDIRAVLCYKANAASR
jgi:hypothetical protein